MNQSNLENIGIIGCGHGAQALAADLSAKGYPIHIYAHSDHMGGSAAIKSQGGIYSHGMLEGFSPIGTMTSNAQQVMEKCQTIFIVLPSFAHKEIFLMLLPFIKSTHKIITIAANFASLLFLNLFRQFTTSTALPLFVDVLSLPYACRADNQGNVDIISIKKSLGIATLPSNQVHQQCLLLQKFFPSQLMPYENVLSAGLNITSGISHPAVTLFNAGRISAGKPSFYFYKEGITPEIAHLLEQLDKDRQEIAKRLQCKTYSYLEHMNHHYDCEYESIYDFYRNSKVHNHLQLCPQSLKARYITQDVPDLLVPWYDLGKLVDYDSRILHNLIELAGLLNNTNYFEQGRNAQALNLKGKTLKQIHDYLNGSSSSQRYCHELKVPSSYSELAICG